MHVQVRAAHNVHLQHDMYVTVSGCSGSGVTNFREVSQFGAVQYSTGTVQKWHCQCVHTNSYNYFEEINFFFQLCLSLKPALAHSWGQGPVHYGLW